MNDEVLAEVRAIGAATASAPEIHERDTVAARVAGLLADPDDPEARDEFIRWAERTAARGPTAEMRSAARLLLTLLRDGAPPAVLHTVDPPIRISINPRVALVVALVAACLTAGGVMAARAVSTPTLKVMGPSNGTLVGPKQNGRIVFTAAGSARLLRRERWWLDGREVVAPFRDPSDERPGYFIELTVGDGQVTAIRDFRYVPYILQDAAIELAR